MLHGEKITDQLNGSIDTNRNLLDQEQWLDVITRIENPKLAEHIKNRVGLEDPSERHTAEHQTDLNTNDCPDEFQLFENRWFGPLCVIIFLDAILGLTSFHSSLWLEYIAKPSVSVPPPIGLFVWIGAYCGWFALAGGGFCQIIMWLLKVFRGSS